MVEVVPADRLHDRLERLSTRNQTKMLRLWAQFAPRGFDGQDEWHDATKPIAEAAAQAAVDLTAAYTTALGHTPEPVSPLVVAEAGARMYDPYDAMAIDLSKGIDYASALLSGGTSVEALSLDVVHQPARASLSYLAPHASYVRRLNSTACKWCMRFASTVFPSAVAADFGHPNCKCQPFESGVDVDSHNASVRDAAGFDAQAEERFDHRAQARRLKNQVKTARGRQEQARIDQRTEPDPVRRERLSTREQEWETRAEAAAERLRILNTGTHRLAA